MLFFRSTTEKRKLDCTEFLVNSCASFYRTSAFMIGGGPSLKLLSHEQRLWVQHSPAAKFSMNLCGRGPDGEGWIIKPTHWASFDPTYRFSGATYNDPSIMKFFRGSRVMDIIPEGIDKVCDCPNAYFCDMGNKAFSNFIDLGSDKLNHSLDSFIMTLDIAIRLGFRKIYCLGTDMAVRPSPAQLHMICDAGVNYDTATKSVQLRGTKPSVSTDLLGEIITEYSKHREINTQQAYEELAKCDREEQYSFGETKALRSAVSSDKHYWERVQYLRLSRKNLATNGIDLISCTPDSRLNDWFPYVPVEDAIKQIEYDSGSVSEEILKGRYGRAFEKIKNHKMVDINPYGWGTPELTRDNPAAPEKKGTGCKGCGEVAKKTILKAEKVEKVEKEVAPTKPATIKDKFRILKEGNIEVMEIA